MAKKPTGRPVGRPAGSTDALGIDGRVAARQHADAAMKRLVHLMTRSKNESIQLAAAVEILNRAYGKPAQNVALTGAEGGPIQHEITSGDAERFTSAISGIIARAAGEIVDTDADETKH
ncbi:hypothetical protein ACSBOB_19610 [Mesorhizobium sp. ASY16-5R]|uniref:hypothetical protein n=1 Tax=Mesorhizobium sp. ASY16-5R TaxID=3445772 RepID=UPI003FA04C35